MQTLSFTKIVRRIPLFVWELPLHGMAEKRGSNCTKRGSTLVGAVFLALIFAISGVAYLWVVRHAGEQERRALQETQGVYASESGLEIGTRKLSESGLPGGKVWVIDSAHRLAVNKLWVDVDAEEISSSSYWSGSSSSGLKTMKINARAYDDTLGGNFIKRVSWTVRELNAFEYGFFSNGVGSNGNKEFCGQKYFGNTYFTAKSATKGKMNLVCTHPEHGCNEYYSGISIVAQSINEHKDCKLDSTTIQNDSTPLYKSLLESIEVPSSYQYLAQNLRHLNSPDTIHLNGSGPLIFNADGSATFGATTYASVDKKIFIASSGILSVKGTVKGSTTVVSDSNAKIKVVGDLVYADLSSSSSTPPTPPTSINSASSNYLGLVTDGGVLFDNSTGPLSVSAAIVSWDPNLPKTPPELAMVDNKSGNARVTLTGTALVGQMEKDFSPFTFVQDYRLLNTAPPGFPPGGKVNNLFRFEIRNWEESNIH